MPFTESYILTNTAIIHTNSDLANNCDGSGIIIWYDAGAHRITSEISLFTRDGIGHMSLYPEDSYPSDILYFGDDVTYEIYELGGGSGSGGSALDENGNLVFDDYNKGIVFANNSDEPVIYMDSSDDSLVLDMPVKTDYFSSNTLNITGHIEIENNNGDYAKLHFSDGNVLVSDASIQMQNLYVNGVSYFHNDTNFNDSASFYDLTNFNSFVNFYNNTDFYGFNYFNNHAQFYNTVTFYYHTNIDFMSTPLFEAGIKFSGSNEKIISNTDGKISIIKKGVAKEISTSQETEPIKARTVLLEENLGKILPNTTGIVVGDTLVVLNADVDGDTATFIGSNVEGETLSFVESPFSAELPQNAEFETINLKGLDDYILQHNGNPLIEHVGESIHNEYSDYDNWYGIGEENSHVGIVSSDRPTWERHGVPINLATLEDIGNLASLNVTVVSELPTENISSTTIYLKPTSNANVYEQYIYANEQWLLIGNTELSLDNFATKEELNQKAQVQIITWEDDD